MRNLNFDDGNYFMQTSFQFFDAIFASSSQARHFGVSALQQLNSGFCEQSTGPAEPL
jgi:hypothetical protein